MMFRRFFPAVLCCVLLLTGCSANGSEASSPAGAESASASPGTAVSAGKAVKAEDEVRAMYKDNDGMTVQKITPYNGDFLVQYGLTGGPWWFDWVYGDSGTRYKLMFCDEGIRDCEIQGTGNIRVLTDGVNCNVPCRAFPHIQIASVSIVLDADGEPLPYGEAYPDSSGTETYWAGIDEASSFGMTGRREVVINASVGVSGVEFAFGPPADMEGFGSFFAAYCTPPGTEISFNKESRVMTIVFHDTSLSSGESPAFTNAAAEASYQQWLRDTGVIFPTDFPAGTLDGSNPLISKAAIQENGGDTVVKLILTENATEYTVESGYTGPDDMGPYFRIILRERSNW
jgi:hypothetical protein